VSAPVAQAKYLHERAVAEQNFGRPKRALTLLHRAVAVLADVPATPERDGLLARVWITLGYNGAEIDGAVVGLSAVSRALELALALEDPALIGEAHAQRAAIASRSGSLEVADEAFEAAERYRHHLSSISHFSLLLNRGNQHLTRSELASARRQFGRAVEIARSAGMRVEEFKALHNLAYAQFLGGDLPLALRNMEAAGAIDADISRGVWHLDRARVLVEAGLTSDADRSLVAATQILAAHRANKDLCEAELERARCALVAGDVDTARRLAASARNRFRRRGNEAWRRSADLVLLQADLAAGRPGKRLAPPAMRLRNELRADGLRVPARTASLLAAEALLTAHDLSGAATELATLGRDSPRDPITARLHACYVRARVEAAAGKRGPAAKRIGRGLAELAKYQSSFGSVDLSSAAAIHGRRLAELDVDLAVDSGRASAIYAAAERGRAVTSRLTPVRPPEDEVTADLLAELRQLVESLHAVGLNPRASAPLLRARRDLESRIAERAWTRPGEREVGAVAALAEVEAGLAPANSVLVSYVLSGPTLLAVVVGNGTVRYTPLGPLSDVIEQIRKVRADLDVLAQPRLPAAIALAVRASFDRSAAKLDATLIKPLGVGGGIVLVTTGLLGAVPWNALPSLRGTPVTVAPSATAWLAATNRAKRTGGRRVVSIAGPGLARSHDEAADVAQAWGSAKLLIGNEATGSNLNKAMASARVVHVAAHGTHQNENPLFSSLRLSDGPLFAHELDQTAGTPEHVVLSACELGLATVRPGDEALGLTSVLLRLGTRSVVSGVARIGDDIAAETMGAYHRLLAAGKDSASALADAAAASDHPVPLVCFGATWRK
jgi:hypothetical protein